MKTLLLLWKNKNKFWVLLFIYIKNYIELDRQNVIIYDNFKSYIIYIHEKISIYINIIYNTHINNSLLDILTMYNKRTTFTQVLLFTYDKSIIQEILNI